LAVDKGQEKEYRCIIIKCDHCEGENSIHFDKPMKPSNITLVEAVYDFKDATERLEEMKKSECSYCWYLRACSSVKKFKVTNCLQFTYWETDLTPQDSTKG